MASRLSSYVGTLMQHTPKAVRAGAPADRVFAICKIGVFDGEEVLLAWKCDRLTNGKLWHPAYAKPLASTDRRLFTLASRNGSEPTALFRPDSYYQLAKF